MKQYFARVVDSTVEIRFETEGECEAKTSFLNQYRSYLIAAPSAAPDLKVIVKRLYTHVFLQKQKTSFISLFHEEKGKTFVYSENQSDYLNQIFYKIVMQTLIFRQKLFLVHASASLVNGQAVLFVGESGSGKSTVVQLVKPWHQPLSDDMAILRKEKRKLFLYQVPYEEKNNYRKSNQAYPVSHIYVLRKSDRVSFRRLSASSNYDYLAKICGNMFVDNNRQRVAGFAFGLHGLIEELSFPLGRPVHLARQLSEREDIFEGMKPKPGS